MKYRVTHQTQYRYAEQVPLCHNLICLRPRNMAIQTCLEHTLTIKPTPAEMRQRTDFYGNTVVWVAIQEPHYRLEIDAKSLVEVNPGRPLTDLGGPAWEQTAAMLASGNDPGASGAREFTFDSPYITRNQKLADFARADFPPGKPLLSCIMNLTQRICHEFTFDTGATTIGTPVLEVLEHRHGVCQDFAHLEIGCLRSLGLAARYVSGYVVTHPPPGQTRLIGADASHAWISAYAPEQGWVDFDPTNGLMPHGKHVTIGWGRDYDDVSPIKGIITGGHRHTLGYAVNIEPVEETAREDAKAVENSAAMGQVQSAES